jgi:hypothetical protein
MATPIAKDSRSVNVLKSTKLRARHGTSRQRDILGRVDEDTHDDCVASNKENRG